jgi:hypothetical protein
METGEFLDWIKFHAMRNETYVDFHVRFSTIVDRIGPGSLGITGGYNDDYKPALKVVKSILDIILKSEFTPEISRQDDNRDDSYHGLVAAVEAACHSSNPVKRAAGETLRSIIEHYGNIARKNYKDETSAIDDLARELDTPAHKALVTAAGVDEQVEQLRASNKKFLELEDARLVDITQRPAARMKDARVVLDKALRALIKRVEAQITLYGMTSTSSDYAPFTEQWNALVAEFRQFLALEQGRRDAARERGEEGEGEEV